MKKSLKSLIGGDAFWMVNKKLVRFIGCVESGVLISFLVDKEDYHIQTGELIEKDGRFYFYATSEKIEFETSLTYGKQKKCLKILSDEGMINIIKMGLPAKLYFSIDENVILSVLLGEKTSSKQVLVKPKTKNLGNANSSISETPKQVLVKRDDILITKPLITKDKEQKNNSFSTLFPISQEIDKKEAKKRGLILGCVLVIEYFNELSGRNVSTKEDSENVKYVLGLRKTVGNFEDIKLMIQFKCWEWKDDKKMAVHLKPVTIFKRHGQRYVEEALEAKTNEVYQNALKSSKDEGKGGKGGFKGGELTKGVANRLKNF